MNSERLLSVDPSLTCSGWALFDIGSERILAVGKLRSLSCSVALSERLKNLYERVSILYRDFKISNSDLIVCEAPTAMIDPRAAFKVEQVRCIFEDIARERGAKVPGRLNPRSVQREVMGLNGSQIRRELVKSVAVKTARSIYEKELRELGFPTDEKSLHKHQDVVDALLVGRLAVIRTRAAILAGLNINDTFQEGYRNGSR